MSSTFLTDIPAKTKVETSLLYSKKGSFHFLGSYFLNVTLQKLHLCFSTFGTLHFLFGPRSSLQKARIHWQLFAAILWECVVFSTHSMHSDCSPTCLFQRPSWHLYQKRCDCVWLWLSCFEQNACFHSFWIFVFSQPTGPTHDCIKIGLRSHLCG